MKVLPELLALTAMLLLPLSLRADAADTPASWLSRSGYYRVSYTSELQPIAINQIHRWTFHVETPDGEPVEGASLTVTGGMPLHNHGLPTEPRMVEELGGGDYVVAGMRFHMNGYWELTVTIDAGGRRDIVVIPVTI